MVASPSSIFPAKSSKRLPQILLVPLQLRLLPFRLSYILSPSCFLWVPFPHFFLRCLPQRTLFKLTHSLSFGFASGSSFSVSDPLHLFPARSPVELPDKSRIQHAVVSSAVSTNNARTSTQYLLGRLFHFEGHRSSLAGARTMMLEKQILNAGTSSEGAGGGTRCADLRPSQRMSGGWILLGSAVV